MRTHNITISEEAADCLAWFTSHPYYGDTLSDVIVDLTKEWGTRERKDLDEMGVRGEYEYYLSQNNQREYP